MDHAKFQYYDTSDSDDEDFKRFGYKWAWWSSSSYNQDLYKIMPLSSQRRLLIKPSFDWQCGFRVDVI